MTTIMDCEDSVAAVDAEDKVRVYRNWLGLMQGDADRTFDKGGQDFTAQAQPGSHVYTRPDGRHADPASGRSLMLVRNVGHLMTNPAILDGATARKSPKASWTPWSRACRHARSQVGRKKAAELAPVPSTS